MKGYIQNVIKEWSNKNIRDYVKPADDDLFYEDKSSEASKDAKKFHRTVAQLLYLCKRARPDIQLAVHYLCTRVKNPTLNDERKLDRVVGYLKGTIDRGRLITKDGEMTRIFAYIDAAFAAHEYGKSHSGAVIMMGNTMLEGITGKQKCASHDSTEAELIALCDMSTDVLWHHEWFEHQGYQLLPPLIYQDNTSTMTLVKEGGGKLRTKHMRAKQAVIKEAIDYEYYQIKHVTTDKMVADVLTKPLGGEAFHKFAKIMLGFGNRIIRRLKTEGVRCDNDSSDGRADNNGKPRA